MRRRKDRKREIVGLDICPIRDGNHWAGFLKTMVRRGLHSVKLVISGEYRMGRRGQPVQIEGKIAT